MNYSPLVSIIIPTYNRAELITKAINSVLSQTYKNVQIIVVDDGSSDNTKDVLSKYQNVHYVYKQNGGQASARNMGLKFAKGTLIASLDSDDEWYPNFLECCVDKILKNNLDFVFANWDQEDADGRVWNFLENDPYLNPYVYKKNNNWIELNNTELRHLYIQACPSPSSSFVTRIELIRPGWNSDIKIGDDWYVYLRIILSGKRKAAFTLEKLWKKKVTEQNVFDGRKRSEVLEYLYIADTGKILSDFKHKLSANEYKLMQKKYVYGLVELAKHKLVRNINFVDSFKLLSRSLILDFPHALWSIKDVIRIGFKRIAPNSVNAKNEF